MSIIFSPQVNSVIEIFVNLWFYYSKIYLKPQISTYIILRILLHSSAYGFCVYLYCYSACTKQYSIALPSCLTSWCSLLFLTNKCFTQYLLPLGQQKFLLLLSWHFFKAKSLSKIIKPSFVGLKSPDFRYFTFFLL